MRYNQRPQMKTKKLTPARKTLRNRYVQTECVRVNSRKPNQKSIARAAEIIRSGGLVAFATETVYGLGANALDPKAVARIFEAKGRPAHNPVIVHVASLADARKLVEKWPIAAQRLAKKFWPGPLTLVLKKRAIVPSIVTAGGPTVAIRMPAHGTAQALLKAARVPIAAPSANQSARISATTAEHVRRGLSGRIEMILDAGRCPGGVESTVLDVSVSPARLLRPGSITPSQIEAVIGAIRGLDTHPRKKNQPLPSPGLLERHYAPRARVESATDSGKGRVEELLKKKRGVGWIAFRNQPQIKKRNLVMLRLPKSSAGFAAKIYAALHKLDDASVQHIVISALPEGEEWMAIRDRLRRAAAQA
jgi:L-threonylcarbamoyladenylate synthase